MMKKLWRCCVLSFVLRTSSICIHCYLSFCWMIKHCCAHTTNITYTCCAGVFVDISYFCCGCWYCHFTHLQRKTACYTQSGLNSRTFCKTNRTFSLLPVYKRYSLLALSATSFCSFSVGMGDIATTNLHTVVGRYLLSSCGAFVCTVAFSFVGEQPGADRTQIWALL